MFNNDWDEILGEEMKKKYFQALTSFVDQAYQNKLVAPPKERLFYAFQKTPFADVRVVIIGQDPYPEEGVATGLAFATFAQNKIPRSLENIQKLLREDQDKKLQDKELEHWAEQGVFLLNTILTTEVGKVNSHRDIGWEVFTNAVIKKISDQKEGVVFVLLGKQAQTKEELIDKEKHHIIKTTHPSPQSAHRGFLKSKLFTQINEKLTTAIKW